MFSNVSTGLSIKLFCLYMVKTKQNKKKTTLVLHISCDFYAFMNMHVVSNDILSEKTFTNILLAPQDHSRAANQQCLMMSSVLLLRQWGCPYLLESIYTRPTWLSDCDAQQCLHDDGLECIIKCLLLDEPLIMEALWFIHHRQQLARMQSSKPDCSVASKRITLFSFHAFGCWPLVGALAVCALGFLHLLLQFESLLLKLDQHLRGVMLLTEEGQFLQECLLLLQQLQTVTIPIGLGASWPALAVQLGQLELNAGHSERKMQGSSEDVPL